MILLALLAFAALSSTSDVRPLEWWPCDDTYGLPHADCARLGVPLDYTDANSPLLRLDLLRLPAAKQPAKGSIVINFGGPGASGRKYLGAQGLLLQALSGGEYNLISWDPRGSSGAIPFICLKDEYEMQAFVETQKFAYPGSNDFIGRMWARGTIDAKLCAERQNNTGRLMGTAFSARDVKSIAEALGEDGLIRYWGFSYGTTLGATLVAMFPDKIDKVILDGVQNPHEYYHALGDFEEWSQTDEIYDLFFDECVRANCTLTRHSSSARELQRKVDDKLTSIKTRPIAIGQVIYDYTDFLGIINDGLYSMAAWPNLASVIDLILSNDTENAHMHKEADAVVAHNKEELHAMVDFVYSLMGIHCSERLVRAPTFEEFVPAMDKMFNVSRIIAASSLNMLMTCAQWTMDAKEVYKGDFHVEPKNPVLLIGNTYDAYTPIRSARNVSSGFKGSEVLEVNGYGHCTTTTPSKCVRDKISAYWNNRTMPAAGTKCEVDKAPFSNTTWSDVLGVQVNM